MFVQNKNMEKLAVIAVMAVLLLGGCSVLCSDFSLAGTGEAEAETEATVEQIDPVKINVDGEEVEVDAFKYQGIIYAVTSDRESEEEAGVYGIDPEFTGSAYIVVCAFAFGEEDEEITYTVTNVLSEFNNIPQLTRHLILADTIVDFGDDCFKKMSTYSTDTLYVSNDVDDNTIAATGYPNIKRIGEVNVLTVKFSYDKGDITYPQDKYKSQTMDDQEIFADITTQFSECSFENPYYEFNGWLRGDNVVAGDRASITYYGGSIYIDGVKYDSAVDNMAFTATWVESDYDEDHKNFGDYPLTYMYITSAIVILLFIIGFAMLGYRMYTARKA